MKRTVELRPAYEWICDDCGRANFVSAILEEMSDEDRVEMQAGIGEEDADGDFLLVPDSVTCEHCKSEFAVECDGEITEEL